MSEQAKVRQEACCNASETEYFGARSQIDTLMQRHSFCAGFYRGYAAAISADRAARAPADSVLEDAARDVLSERARQISAEGWTSEHDDEHQIDGDLAQAAACYAHQAFGNYGLPTYWPWAEKWWKPSKDPRRNLIKAGALILAEIERMDRAARKQGANHD